MEIRCAYDELVDISTLKPHPKNRNKHSEHQIKRLSEIISYQGIRRPVRVSKLSGYITAGHGLLSALLLLRETKVPVDYQDYENQEQEYADVQADNAIASWAELDLAAINLDIPELGPDFDLNMLGIQNFVLEPADKFSNSDLETYTRKIKIPIYEPKGLKPQINELVDTSKTELLVKEIEDADIPKNIKEFLKLAAYRHSVFNYENIAEFYSHSDENVKALFEKSALVIIDFNKAIENGFIELAHELAEAYSNDE